MKESKTLDEILKDIITGLSHRIGRGEKFLLGRIDELEIRIKELEKAIDKNQWPEHEDL